MADQSIKQAIKLTVHLYMFFFFFGKGIILPGISKWSSETLFFTWWTQNEDTDSHSEMKSVFFTLLLEAYNNTLPLSLFQQSHSVKKEKKFKKNI